MKNRRLFYLCFIFSILSATMVFAVDMRVLPETGKIIQAQQPHPDLAVTNIQFKLISKTGPGAGTIEFIGTATNIGSADLTYGGKLKLFCGNNLLAETPFSGVARGQSVVVKHQVTYGSTPFVIVEDLSVRIVYDLLVNRLEKYDEDSDYSNNQKNVPLSDALKLLQ